MMGHEEINGLFVQHTRVLKCLNPAMIPACFTGSQRARGVLQSCSRGLQVVQDAPQCQYSSCYISIKTHKTCCENYCNFCQHVGSPGKQTSGWIFPGGLSSPFLVLPQMLSFNRT
ncbi:hypothetical protein GOODEAATRI_030979 [Goodea atripinnis]|uniref:Uncharacterized protein n=1 Tax=Goodea atripinnis TaxID=208336 RepID=A0ABV0Q2I2_9TELE